MAITQYAVPSEPRADASRNVRDIYKKSLDAEIRADLESNRSAAVQVLLNSENDFNVATAIRTANALNISRTYIVGRRKYDRRGTVGSHNYTKVFSSPEYSEVFALLQSEGYSIYAIEKVEKLPAQNLWDCALPEKSAFVFGTENMGIPLEVIAECDAQLEISMYGSVRSFNLATASAIVLAEYSRQWRKQ